MARPEKVEAVKEIVGRFKDSDAALLTEYRGLRVGEIAEVRTALRDAGAEYKVLKNTLTRLAVREVGLEELVEMLEGPTAVVFCGQDAAAAAKALDEAAKKFPVLVVKGGVISGKIIGADQARELAKLEPRDVQLTKIAMMMNAPAQQTVNVLSALLRDLGLMLAQVQAQKEEEAPPAAAEVGQPAAETEAPAETEAEGPAEEAPAAEVPVEEAPEAEEPVAQTTGEDEATTPTAEDAGQPPAETPEAEEQAEAAPESEEAGQEEVSKEE